MYSVLFQYKDSDMYFQEDGFPLYWLDGNETI